MQRLGLMGMRAHLAVLALALFILLVPCPSDAYIYAHYSNMTPMSFEDRPALFGGFLPIDGLMGVLVEARPQNACLPIEPPPPPETPGEANLTKYIVLIRRFDCNFDIKVLHAQQAGFSGAIIHNMYSDTLLNMNYSNATIAAEIEIPSVFTSFYTSQVLRNFIIPEKGAYVILKPDFPFPLAYYLIPFTGVVGMIILVMVIILVVRCVQYRKRLRKNRLTKEQLKKIPIHKFNKVPCHCQCRNCFSGSTHKTATDRGGQNGDEYDVCAICLDEYEEGDKLRVLPCSHAYHCRCVDPWLTQTKKTCPVCKQRVTRPNPECSESSDSDEDAGSRTDEEGGGGGTATADEASSERTPLLRASNPASPLSGSPSTTYASTVAAVSVVTTVTTAQCLAHTPQRDSPLLGYDGYYSPEEDSDEELSGDDDDDTAQLIGRGAVGV